MNQKLKKALLFFHRKVYTKIFPDLVSELGKELGSCKTVLDLGCGDDSPIRYFSKNFYSEGVDIFPSAIKKSKKRLIHNKYHEMNVITIDKKFKSRSFDCVLALDLIEHLEKKDGLDLMKKMESIASKKSIIFTANGFLPQRAYGGNKWQVHKSGWTIKEMKKLGYKVIGINGIKFLRGEYARIRFWPKYFWWVVSDVTQLFVRSRPERAFQMLCVKNLGGHE